MKDEKKEVKQFDVLDDIRAAEKKIKRAAFLKMIPKLKAMAKEVNTLKKKAEYLLDEVGIEEKDVKRVIDFINSLPSVELSEKELKDLRENIKEDVEETKIKTEKDFEKSLEKFSSLNSSSVMTEAINNMYSSTGGNFTSGGYYSKLGSGNNVVLTASGKSLNVNI